MYTFHLGKQQGRTCCYKPWTSDARAKSWTQDRMVWQTPKLSKTKDLGGNPKFKPVRPHWLNTTSISLHPTLILCIASTCHTAPLSLSCSRTCGARLRSLAEVWSRAVTKKSKCAGEAAVQDAMKPGEQVTPEDVFPGVTASSHLPTFCFGLTSMFDALRNTRTSAF